MLRIPFPHHPWPGLVAASLASLLVLDSRPAMACSCAMPQDPGAAMASADVVFEGTPRDTVTVEADLGIADYRGARRFDFEVARYFKGQLGPDVAVYTIDQSSACGRNYSLDEPHIIYARYSDDGLLTDFACSRSGPSSFASDDGPILGDGVAPDPALVADDDGDGSGVSSGIRHVPLAERDARGCSFGSRAPHERPWLGVAAGLALAALQTFRRRAR